MTAREAIYKTALEHIRDGHDMICLGCGWVGCNAYLEGSFEVFSPTMICSECGSIPVKTQAPIIAAYALAQGERGE